MRKFFVYVGLGLALVLGVLQAPAHAGTTSVTYSLTGNLVIQGVGNVGPAPGAGSITITFPTQSNSFTTILPGPVHVAAFSFAQNIHVLSFIVGAVQLGGASMNGVLGPSGTLSLAFAGHVVAGQVHCLAGTATCGGVGLPASVPVALTSLPLGGVFGATVAMGNPSTLGGYGVIGGFLGQALALSVTGTEISRTHPTPEPGLLGLFGTAGAAMLAFGVRRLRA
jgi:hypothetical protein